MSFPLSLSVSNGMTNLAVVSSTTRPASIYSLSSRFSFFHKGFYYSSVI
jgi:hypothetical protein